MSNTMREHFLRFRHSKNVHMLIPMEASMGYPIVLNGGTEYMIPFYRCDYVNSVCYPPFAYIRVSYPEGNLLNYCDLRFTPGWRDIDYSIPLHLGTNVGGDEYYQVLLELLEYGKITSVDSRLYDEILTEYIKKYRLSLLPYYEKLLKEKEKFEEGTEN